MDEAWLEYCRTKNIEISHLIRESVCEKIGRPELIETMRDRGRPVDLDAIGKMMGHPPRNIPEAPKKAARKAKS